VGEIEPASVVERRSETEVPVEKPAHFEDPADSAHPISTPPASGEPPPLPTRTADHNLTPDLIGTPRDPAEPGAAAPAVADPDGFGSPSVRGGRALPDQGPVDPAAGLTGLTGPSAPPAPPPLPTEPSGEAAAVAPDPSQQPAAPPASTGDPGPITQDFFNRGTGSRTNRAGGEARRRRPGEQQDSTSALLIGLVVALAVALVALGIVLSRL
jgi:hypothetical protein